MSTDDPKDARGRRPRWPMSSVNMALVALCALIAAVFFVAGQPLSGVLLLVAGLLVGAGAVFARRRRSGDLERVNALEYADERDRVAATKGLAAVGVLALLLSAVQLIVHAIVGTDELSRLISSGTLVVLVVGWFLANWYFVRRG